ncbi:AraC family transcriptional regulator [Streptomyces aurantiacus]|uniref:AraC family transcriptional regulator n=1 Tax=Streptomyces aurantiacus TaxID=47760 RepID=A0A7G1PG36_9ACTN|nr:AraC family transcriptional regulator [Streptomyces aurantiacus]BCL32155.1 AraC family transcriptional regulator [Streptomyces aurantiacus]
MDVIEEVVGSARAGRAFARRIRESGPWGMRFPAFTGVGFHAVLQGSGWLISAAEKPVALRSGDIVLAGHGAEHGLSHTPGVLSDLPVSAMGSRQHDPRPAAIEMLCSAYRLDGGQVHLFLRQLPAVIRVSPDYGRHPELRSLIDLLDIDVTQSRLGIGVTRSALVDLLLVHVLRLWQEEQGSAAWPAIDAAVAAALREIHQSPQTPWTVQQLSVMAGMSRTAFTRRFTSAVGKPPMAYLIGWRMVRGAQLLRETEAPLSAIARQIGYSSEYAFAVAFRREFGVSPGRFRRRAQAPGDKLG